MNTSLADVARAVEMTKGAVYFHFESKEVLALALIDEQHRISRDAATEILTVDRPALQQMMLLCADLARRLMNDPIVQAGIKLTTDSTTFASPIREPYRDWLATFEMLSTLALQAGDITRDIPATTLANFIIPAFTGVQLVSDTLADRDDLYERVRDMWRILIYALTLENSRDDWLRIVDEIFSVRSR
ncbi:AcrR family transcriptional regulator [Agromyces terreus]|uniref:AcrR family transcriptional regulator n=1 Tax=Agromyces terreus TaxID=424795 RepID=A0A9X2KAV7_9MICO|nr:AcrR family transcriptional regulator [Agromyces terreus]